MGSKGRACLVLPFEPIALFLFSLKIGGEDLNKTEVVRAKCTKLERAAVEKIAEAEGIKLAEVLRDLIRSEAKRRGIWQQLTELQTAA